MVVVVVFVVVMVVVVASPFRIKRLIGFHLAPSCDGGSSSDPRRVWGWTRRRSAGCGLAPRIFRRTAAADSRSLRSAVSWKKDRSDHSIVSSILALNLYS